MNRLPKKLKSKLEKRQQDNTLRQLVLQNNLTDFSSNDYLGFAKSETIFNKAHNLILGHHMIQNGATGSRLLSGNHSLYLIVESMLCEFHHSEAALIFNSGYDANLGFFSSVAQHGDVVLYDEFIHASIRDGIQLANAKAYKFKHNDLNDLQHRLERIETVSNDDNIYVVTESVFSMDGDSPDLIALSKLCEKHKAFLVVDEAHAVGVFGKKGEGLTQNLGIEDQIFARLVTFGKALGSHGAAILGGSELKEFLINFSRSFIYTTALPPHSLATIVSAYTELPKTEKIEKLHQTITYFKSEIQKLGIQNQFIDSNSAIQCCIVSGNESVKSVAKMLQDHDFDVRPILSPTVPKGQERLRFCLHSYNSQEEISEVLRLLATFVK
jgi:8-amino-7-oxononanoate synthase